MKLTGNTVLITGGGSGIGLAFARELVSRSNKVIICGRNIKKLEAVKNNNPLIDYFMCDISNEGDQKRLVAFMQANYPEMNVLINNAGIQHNYNFDDLNDHTSVIDEEININFLAQVKLTDRFLSMVLTQPESIIINITSALAMVPKQSAPVYCATKAAMHIFTKALRFQLENSAVDIVEVIPPLVDIEMTLDRGKGKISSEALVKEALIGIEAGKKEIRIGKVKILCLLNRFFPALASRIIRYG